MITAAKARAITEDTQIIEKSKKVEEVLNWCKSLENNIIEAAKSGKEKIFISMPRFGNFIFSQSDSNSVIRGFFSPLGYEVSFSMSGDALILEW